MSEPHPNTRQLTLPRHDWCRWINWMPRHICVGGGAVDRPIYVICQSGMRARKAIEKFQQAGFNGCVLVEGGTQAWIDAGTAGRTRRVKGAATDSPSAVGHWILHDAWRCVGTMAGSTLCVCAALFWLRIAARRRHRFMFAGSADCEDAVESREQRFLQFLLRRLIPMRTPRRIIIVGGVAGGVSAAARARRVDECAEIHVFERGSLHFLRQLWSAILYRG